MAPLRGNGISVGGAFMRPWRVYAPPACLCAPGVITFRTRINPGAMNGVITFRTHINPGAMNGAPTGKWDIRRGRIYAPLACLCAPGVFMRPWRHHVSYAHQPGRHEWRHHVSYAHQPGRHEWRHHVLYAHQPGRHEWRPYGNIRYP